MNEKKLILAIDPGREKTGIALLKISEQKPLGEIIRRAIVPTDEAIKAVRDIIRCYDDPRVIMGNGTTSRHASERLTNELNLNITLVDEYRTTDEARELYFADNPPRGIKKLIPQGLLTPPVPVDDYAAVALARRYLQNDDNKPGK